MGLRLDAGFVADPRRACVTPPLTLKIVSDADDVVDEMTLDKGKAMWTDFRLP